MARGVNFMNYQCSFKLLRVEISRFFNWYTWKLNSHTCDASSRSQITLQGPVTLPISWKKIVWKCTYCFTSGRGEKPQPQYWCVHVVYQGESFKTGTYTVHNLQDEPPRNGSLHFLISTNFLSGSKGWLVRSQTKAEKEGGKGFQPKAMKYVGRTPGAKIGLFQNIMQSVSNVPLLLRHLRLYL